MNRRVFRANIALMIFIIKFRMVRRLFVLKRASERWSPARVGHQSFLEGFAYPSFLPSSTSNFYIE